jgi:hypothetical protein
MSRANKERWTNCTAVYVRMSTEHQQYSTSNQMDVIREYAKRRELGIVKEYSDEGKSGLNIQGRDSLAQMNNGVSPERLAVVLNMPLRVVQASVNLLKGIHPDAAELLKDKNICPKSLRLFKRVNGNRQIEMAETMVMMNNYVAGYAEAMVLVTPQHQLVNPDEPKKKAGMSAEEIARMESEMESLEHDLKAVTDNYTENMFTLQTAQTYIKNLLKNAKVVRYLNANHAENIMDNGVLATCLQVVKKGRELFHR